MFTESEAKAYLTTSHDRTCAWEIVLMAAGETAGLAGVLETDGLEPVVSAVVLVVGEVLGTQGGEGLYGLRTVKPVQAWQRLGGYWFRPAVTPPSTSQMAPVIQPAWSERRKVATAETSSVVPIRPIGWKSLNPARTVSTSAGGMKPS